MAKDRLKAPLNGSGKGSGKRPAAAPPLAVLTPDERAAVAAARGCLDRHVLEGRLLERAYQSLLAGVRDRYGLPESFDLDLATGEARPA
jgi:hypothetical protein